jgi:hypothetical protein
MDSKFATALTQEMRAMADAFGLWDVAEVAHKAVEERVAKADRAAMAKHKAEKAGPMLLAAAIGALKLLRRVWQFEVESRGDYSMMPYPEIVELENAITEAGGDAEKTEPANANS